jgi:hypothetical protein
MRSSVLITKQLFQLLACGGFPWIAIALWGPFPQGKLKVFAEIAYVFFQDRFGPAFPALMGNTRIKMGTVQADAQVGPALHAGFAAPGLGGERPGLAAILTMAGQRHL